MKKALFQFLCALLCCAPALTENQTSRPTLFTRKGGSLSVNAMAVSPKGDFFVTAGSDGVTIWSTADGLEYRTFQPYPGYRGGLIAVAADDANDRRHGE